MILLTNMKARLVEKNKAIELRKQGFSYTEIQQIVPVSKGLLSSWLKYLPLSDKEIELLKAKIVERKDKGRISSMMRNRQLRLSREILTFEEAKNTFQKLMSDHTFLIGVALYWAEGAKRHGSFQFVNSDSDMVAFMYKWIQKYLGISHERIKCRLFIHRIQGYEHSERFWAGKLGIDPNEFQKTIYKPTRHAIKKNPNYRGCVRLNITSIRALRLMNAWQKMLVQYYGEMRPWLNG